MTAEHVHSAEDGDHSECGSRRRSPLLSVMAIPTELLRWLVVGCVGLAAFGLIFPFSPIPPCPLRTLTGVPCPMCGMTRSARSMMSLDVGSALRFQPFGALAFFVGLVVLLLWAIPKTRSIAVVRVPLLVVIAVFAASWIWNIGFNPTFS